MADKPALHVTNIRQEHVTEPDGEGSFHDHMRIHFTTPSGTKTHVTLPMHQYSAENAAALIAHQAQQVEQVHAIVDKPLNPPAA